MLKYGANIIQAVGYFNGILGHDVLSFHLYFRSIQFFKIYADLALWLYVAANYIIAVAFVNNLSSFDAPKLDDYAQPVTTDPPGRQKLF